MVLNNHTNILKKCSNCGETKPATNEFFGKHKRQPDGLRIYCKPCNNKKALDWHRKNKDKHTQTMRTYYNKNSEKIKIRAKKWYYDNLDRAKHYRSNYGKEHYRNNKAMYREKLKLWRSLNRVAHNNQVHRRRALKRGSEGEFTREEWDSLLFDYGYRCAHCGTGEKLTVDHVLPLSKGGSNRILNIQPLCGPCNSRKGSNN